MKTAILFIFVFLFSFISCSDDKQELTNGWYYIEDNTINSIAKPPIVTVKDFMTLKIDSGRASDNSIVYQIEGQVKANKIKDFGDATEKSIGKRIGFLYKGEVIATPIPNVRVEGGFFSISSLRLCQNREEVIQIFESLKREME